VFADDRERAPHELNAPFSLDRFVTGALIDEHGAAGWRTDAADPVPVVRGA
jgi:hypothetical protein